MYFYIRGNTKSEKDQKRIDRLKKRFRQYQMVDRGQHELFIADNAASNGTFLNILP